MKIGFVGLGNMGAFMAQNLIKANHSLVVFDLSEKALNTLKEAGAEVKSSAKEVAQSGVDAFITMLPAGAHVRSVYLEKDEALNYLKEGTLVVDSSTIDPATAREVAKVAAQKNINFVDAPVSGGTVGAENATLTFMVGGSDESFDKAKVVLSDMGKNVVHCGGEGNGQVAKLANNLLLGITMVGVSEAMNLGVNLGMDPHTLAAIMNTSTGRSWSSEVNNPWPGVVDTAPATRQYQGGFFTDLMLKDMGLAIEAARQSHSAVPLGATAQQLYEVSSQLGQGGVDFSSIINLLKGELSN